MQASPRPPGPMTAATAQRLVDSNQKQSFPLSSYHRSLSSPNPLRLPLPPSVMQNGPAQTLPHQVLSLSQPSPAGFRLAVRLCTQACPRIRGLFPGSTASPASREHAARSREQKPLTPEPNFRLATGTGRGERRVRGCTPHAHIFLQLFVPAANPILVSKPAAS